MNESFKQRVEIILRWRNLHHLIPVYTDVYSIAERIHDYSDQLFVVFNIKSQKYEIHSVANGPGMPSKELDIPFDELDVRALHHLWKQDIRVHGKEIFRRIEQSEEEAKKRNQRKFKNWVRDVASETRTMFARDAWGDGGKIQFQSAGVGKVETKGDSKTG